MMNWIRSLSDPLLILAMVVFGTLFWILVITISILWDKLKDTMVAKYLGLKRENARLRKYISAMRKEKISGRI